MGVEQARQNRPAVQVDDRGARADEGLGARVIANVDEGVLGHRDGTCKGLPGIGGVDVAVEVDGVSRLGLKPTGPRAPAEDQGPEQEHTEAVGGKGGRRAKTATVHAVDLPHGLQFSACGSRTEGVRWRQRTTRRRLRVVPFSVLVP